MSRKDRNGIVLRKGETQLDSGRYRYRYTDDLGVQHDVYSWTLRLGDKIPEGKEGGESLREKEQEIAKSLMDGLDAPKANLNLNTFIVEYIEINKEHWSNSTYNAYDQNFNKYIKDQIGQKKVSKITADNIYNFYNGIYNSDNHPLKLTSIKSIDRLVRPALQLAVDKRVIRFNPAQGVVARLRPKKRDSLEQVNIPEKKVVQALEDEEQKKLLDFIKKYYCYLYYYPLFYLLAWTGCRISELLALTWYDVDFQREVIHIRRSLSYQPDKTDRQRRLKLEPPKTAAGYREIPMLRDVKSILQELKSQLRNPEINPFGDYNKISVDDPTPFVLLNRDGQLIHYSCLERKLHAIIDDYNEKNDVPLPQITCHVFRHTFTCWLCENVEKSTPMETIKYIQSILGHADASVTLNIYAECRRKKRHENHEMLKRIAAEY